MNDWLAKAELKMEKEKNIGANYDAVKKQLEGHQVCVKNIELGERWWELRENARLSPLASHQGWPDSTPARPVP